MILTDIIKSPARVAAGLIIKQEQGPIITTTKSTLFNPIDDRIDCGNGAPVQITGPITVCAHVYLAATGGNRYIMSKWDSVTPNRGWQLQYDGNSFHVELDADGGSGGAVMLDSILNPSAGVWYHVCFVYDGAEVRIYINGVEDNSVAYSGGIHNSVNPLLIGAVNNGIFGWNGSMILPMVFNTDLSDSEISLIAGQADTAVSFQSLPPSLQAKCVMAIEASERDPSLTDLSGTGSNGTAKGGIVIGTGQNIQLAS